MPKEPSYWTILMKPPLDAPPVDPGCLLLVDDESFVLSSLGRLFRKDGYDIVGVETPQKGMEILTSRAVAVIVSDYRMPEMDGVQFLRRAREIAPDAIRIILSGYAEINAIITAVNDGGIHKYLTKPWNDEQLRLEVKAGFDQYLLTRTNRVLQETLQQRNAELLELTKSLEAEKERQQESFRTTIEMLVALPKMKDPAAVIHTERVRAICRAMATTVGWPEDEMELLDLAARLHDVGNLGVDSRILLKDGALTSEERQAVQQHTIHPAQILAGVRGMDEVVRVIRSHHENFDGSGYPDGLKGEAIPRASQMLYLADMYDALCSVRPYRKPMRPQEALEHITKEVGRSFDPALIDPFRAAIDMIECSRAA